MGGSGFKTLEPLRSGAMAEDSDVAEQVAGVHDDLHDVQTDIGDMEDGVDELHEAFNAVTMARQHIAEYAKSREDIEAEEVLTP